MRVRMGGRRWGSGGPMSQVNFFMAEDDERKFFAFLLARGDTAIHLGRKFQSQSPEPLDALPPPVERVLTIVHSGLAEIYPPQQESASGHYAFPLFSSAWVEWTRSASIGDALEAGRVFAKVGWLSEPANNRVYKLWYAAIESCLKRSMRRLDETWWIGPAAEAWSQTGGILAFGPGPSSRRSLADGRDGEPDVTADGGRDAGS